ncbi:hypothetical protein BV20DRAFT_535032 [Pilatotrama ljubarskyi]|nr:hypothetical protein BV20DRAFT_535032 [Pilatotrama ljubarskyi]
MYEMCGIHDLHNCDTWTRGHSTADSSLRSIQPGSRTRMPQSRDGCVQIVEALRLAAAPVLEHARYSSCSNGVVSCMPDGPMAMVSWLNKSPLSVERMAACTHTIPSKTGSERVSIVRRRLEPPDESHFIQPALDAYAHAAQWLVPEHFSSHDPVSLQPSVISLGMDRPTRACADHAPIRVVRSLVRDERRSQEPGRRAANLRAAQPSEDADGKPSYDGRRLRACSLATRAADDPCGAG